MHAVTLRNVNFAYHGPLVLRDVNMTLETHRFLAVIGPNGGGKSTLLKLMLGLYQPLSGTIEMLGRKPRAARRQIGYVSQDTGGNRDFPICVEDVALMGRIGASGRKARFTREDRAVVQEYLERLNVWGYRRERIGRLSGGERQRVMIARALAAKPLLLLLDEPTAGIDAAGEEELYTLLRSLRDEVTLIVVSHDVAAVSQYVDAIACVNQTLYLHGSNRLSIDLLRQVYGGHLDFVLHEAAVSDQAVRVLASHDHKQGGESE